MVKKSGWLCPSLFSLAVLSVLSAGCEYIDCEEPVRTNFGWVKGLFEKESGTCSYRGIPFAAPPVGNMRFRPPRDPEPWDGILDASDFGPACWQPPSPLDPTYHDWFGNEDCLNLHVWRPRKQGIFPVMVFIHGGAFIEGSGICPDVQGGMLAGEQDMVVVTMNYRLGALGLMAHRRLAEEDPRGGTGNYAIMDQIKALKWIKNNIAGFGGNPENITLAGQSAGAISTCILIASPLVRDGLFHKVLMQSGMCDDCLPLSDGFALGDRIAEAIGCPDGPELTSCLRSHDPLEIMTAIPHDPFQYFSSPYKPHIDRYVILEQPIQSLKKGLHRRVPAIIGCNQDEYSTFILSNFDPCSLPLTWNQYESLLQSRYQNLAGDILTLYPPGSCDSPIEALIAIEGDRWFRCRMRDATMAVSRYQKSTYFYHFTFDDFLLGNIIGATHGIELPLIFDTFHEGIYGLFFPLGPGPKARDLSGFMQGYWRNFVYQSDPNTDGLPEWPRYNTSERKHLVLDVPISVDNDLIGEKCTFWNTCGGM